jgi:uncharacterized damage-inducible protein DinB
VEELRELYAYNRWANRRILGAAAALEPEAFGKDMGSSFPSVRDTLVHILAAEWVWLARWQGTSPTGLPSWDLATCDEVRKRWAEVEGEQQAFVEALTEADRRRVIAYRDTSGRAWETELGHMLRHVVNHSSYHRGQVITMLRQLGAETVGTDLIRYYREGGVADQA